METPFDTESDLLIRYLKLTQKQKREVNTVVVAASLARHLLGFNLPDKEE